MFTDKDRKELARLMQKRRRASDTGTRRAMLEWNRTHGKTARKKYMANGGAERSAKRRAPGTTTYAKAYARKQRYRKESAMSAKNARSEWTLKDERLLLQMVIDGKSARDISIVLGRSIQGIERKRERLLQPND